MLGTIAASVRWSACAIATLGTLSLSVACGRSPIEQPPAAYSPLPVIDTLPMVLDDRHATRDYLNAFPILRYEKYTVPSAGHFFIDDSEDMIKRYIVDGRQWEHHTLELLEEHVEPGSVVVEIGAHIGSHTVPVARLVGPWGRVYAFEPQRKIYRELVHNVALNGITNVVPLRYAVGDGDARVIELNPTRLGNEGGTSVGSGGDQAELRSLDSFGFERVSVLKIDVEGYEDEVLKGAVNTIRRSRPIILIEIMGGNAYDTAPPKIRDRIEGTWSRLETLGYDVTPVYAHDYVATPRE